MENSPANDWLFLGEQRQNGVPFLLAKNMANGALYQLEPLAIRIKGNEIRKFRGNILNRPQPDSPTEKLVGILPVTGPLNYLDKWWIGWEYHSGINIFLAPTAKTPFQQLVFELLPLIQSYNSYHRNGFIIGRPDWGRIFRGIRGYFMPDPKNLGCLNTPEILFPEGLMACRPPEEFKGDKYTQSADLYYLGLMLYYILTGAIPYRLENGWPVNNIIAGKNVPLSFYRPDLPAGLSQIIGSLLSPNPQIRPEASRVYEYLELQQQQKIPAVTVKRIAKSRLNRIQINYRPVGIVLVLFLLLTTIFLVIRNLKPNTPSPLEITRRFYRNIGGPPTASYTIQKDLTLIKDFEKAKAERMKTAAEFYRRPLAELQRVKIISKTENTEIYKVVLGWWRWTGREWQQQQLSEIITVQKNKKNWRIVSRKTF